MENPLKHICILTDYLRQHCHSIGLKNYEGSLIRLEHGTGKGFGAVNNTGSSDCLKEQMRNLGVHLGAKYDRLDKIYFNSQKALSISQQNRTADNLRVEHTIELKKDLFPMFEKEFILSNKKKIAPETVYDWIVQHHVAVAIHPSEQITGKDTKKYRENNFKYPFKKYSAPIFYKGKNISNYTYKEIQDINIIEHSKKTNIDFKKIQKKVIQEQKQLGLVKPVNRGHLLPPLDLANRIYNNEIELLNQWYVYKKNKLFNGSSWSRKPKAKKLLSVLK